MCKRAPGRIARHHAFNEVIARAFQSAGIPTTTEPNGLSSSDGKRTVFDSLAGRQAPVLGHDGGLSRSQFLHQTTIGSAGAVAEMAATRKSAKYCTAHYGLFVFYLFV